MPTMTDTLETVMKLTGAQTYAAQMSTLSTGLEKMAQSELTATAGGSGLSSALALVGGEAGIAAGALGAVVGVLGRSLSAFSDSEDTIARLAIRMRNLGNAFPVKELTEFAGNLGDQLGIDDELIAKVGAMAAGFGLNRGQIEKAIPVVLDIAVANKVSPDDVLEKIFQASKGRTRGLIGLNIDPSKLSGNLKDINNLLGQLGDSFAGTAAAFHESLPGLANDIKTSTDNLLESLGRLVSPLGTFLGRGIVGVNQTLRDFLDANARFLHIPTAADIGGGNASKITLKGDPEQTASLKGIEANTGKMSDAIIKQVLGGPGTIARQAFTLRDAKLAFRI
jgi:hypothetical protein